MIPNTLPIFTSETHQPVVSVPGKSDDALREAARGLETSFLTEMLKSAGFGKTRDVFGGGAGEDQFSSLLVRAQAEKIVEAGGIGLAETLFEALKGKHDGPV